MLFYHATFKANIEGIIEKGLGAKQRKNWTFSRDGVVYFAEDEYVAHSYCEVAADCPEESGIPDDVGESGIIVLACDFDLSDNDNIIVEDELVEETYMYFGKPISAERLFVVTSKGGIIGRLTELKNIPDFE